MDVPPEIFDRIIGSMMWTVFELRRLRCVSTQFRKLISTKYITSFRSDKNTKIIDLVRLDQIRKTVHKFSGQLVDFKIGYLEYYLMPPSLPKIKYMSCINSSLECIPHIPEVRKLYMINTGLRNNYFPPELRHIKVCVVRDTQITALPRMASLLELDCSNCGLRRLPDMPNLSILICKKNALSSLPDMLLNLTMLDCSSNINIRHLPLMPKIKKLIINDTRISRLPYGPQLGYVICGKYCHVDSDFKEVTRGYREYLYMIMYIREGYKDEVGRKRTKEYSRYSYKWCKNWIDVSL